MFSETLIPKNLQITYGRGEMQWKNKDQNQKNICLFVEIVATSLMTAIAYVHTAEKTLVANAA